MTAPARYPMICALAAFVWFATVQIVAFIIAGGVMEYPLDDPYIHLAMAEQIAAGGYGVNAGEYASAASSPLYPMLLLFQAGGEVQRWLPLVWNAIGVVASGWLWGSLMIRAGLAGKWAVLLAVLAPLFLNIVGAGYVGMEHALDIAASLAVVQGGVVLVQDNRVNGWLILGIALCPLLRFEGMALSLVGAGLVVWHRKWGQGVALLALAVLPLVGFCYYLTTLGLDPFPNSIQAKLEDNDSIEMSRLIKMAIALMLNLNEWGGKLLLAGIVVTGMLVRLAPKGTVRPYGLLVLGVCSAALAHLILGRIGWMNRYEIYAYVALSGALMLVASRWNPAKAAGVTLVWVVISGGYYVYDLSWRNITNTRAIYLQQAQMARFAQDYLKAPVAVNDLGWVAWGNENAVLDLWGLANNEVRRARIFNPTEGWAGDLTAAQNVPVAMVYDMWFDDGLGTDWVPLGELIIPGYVAFLGGRNVRFYATSPTEVERTTAAIDAWIPTLPDGALWVWQKDRKS